uniref:Uncharacterized protein n=1 Tax=Anopheles quadriannulatus TaxID=34691 RepID=A0A182XRJ0_ANOQN
MNSARRFIRAANRSGFGVSYASGLSAAGTIHAIQFYERQR